VNVYRKHSIGAPYPSTFRAKDDVDIKNRMHRILSSSRTTLVTFAGGLARGIGAVTKLRNKLAPICDQSEECNFLNCSQGNFCRDNMDLVIEAHFKSDFCLMPPGDWPPRQALFDALSTGCIPVFFRHVFERTSSSKQCLPHSCLATIGQSTGLAIGLYCWTLTI
jgi:hypothetical protein